LFQLAQFQRKKKKKKPGGQDGSEKFGIEEQPAHGANLASGNNAEVCSLCLS